MGGCMSPLRKKLRLFRAWLSRSPIWCAWQVNYKCNFRCSFCHYWNDPAGQLPEQTIGQFRVGADKLAHLGSLLINIAGGEPLLRTDIVELVATLSRFHLPLLTTNGWLATPQLARELFAAGLWGVSVSVDYADPARHDRQRGMPGAFERAVAALDIFQKARTRPWQRVNLMAVLVHDNLDQLEPLARLAAEHHAYFMVQPYSQRKTGSTRFNNHDEKLSDRLLEMRERNPNMLSNPWFLARFDQAFNGGVPGCRAGWSFFNIDSTGDIAICVERRDRPVANIHRDDIHTIVHRLRDVARHNHCTDCWYNCRGEIESLYRPRGLVRSLPTLLFDRGRAPGQVNVPLR